MGLNINILQEEELFLVEAMSKGSLELDSCSLITISIDERKGLCLVPVTGLA